MGYNWLHIHIYKKSQIKWKHSRVASVAKGIGLANVKICRCGKIKKIIEHIQ